MKSISASSESPFPPTLLELLSENRGLLQGRGNPSNLNQLQRDSAVRTRRHCERRHGVQVLSRGGLRASAVRDQQQRAGCAHRKGLGWWHESPVRLTTTHSTRPISSTETPQTTNAYPLKGAKSGDNLLLSLIRRGKKSFRRLSPALEDSVAAKWTTFNHTPGPTGTQKQQPQDRHREHSSGSRQGQGLLTASPACLGQALPGRTAAAVGLRRGSSHGPKSLRYKTPGNHSYVLSTVLINKNLSTD